MKLLLTRQIPDSALNLLTKYPEIELDYRQGPPMSEKELLKASKDVDAILPVIPDKITADIINGASKLKVIATYSVGYDHIDIGAATNNKVYVANTPGDKASRSVAEFAFAMILALGTKLIDADEFCRSKKYKYWNPMDFLGTRTTEKTLGIIGFGRIGQSLAKMVRGLDMKILYNDVKQLPAEVVQELNATFVSLEDLLQNSDFISIHVNLTKETKHLIDTPQFALMKPEAILVNTSRGPVVNEKSLVVALQDKIIQGAGLDVFEDEPKINPKLLKMKNVVLTPHIASATREVRIQMANMAAQNIIDVLINNKPPTHLVNTELSTLTTSLI